MSQRFVDLGKWEAAKLTDGERRTLGRMSVQLTDKGQSDLTMTLKFPSKRKTLLIKEP